MSNRTERYRLGRLLGRGGVAEVYEAVGVSADGLERRLALKRLLSAEEAQLLGFADEAKIARRLHHPNIVQVLDYGVLDERPFLALELVEGLDLEALAGHLSQAKEPFPTELAVYVALEIAHALSYAHEQRDAEGRPLGIVHRDVTPSNVMVSTRGEVKLSDFGIALANDRSSRTAVGIVKGKRSYMAPEQALGEATDARADLFSLGCVLAFLLTGQSPLGTPGQAEAILRGGTISLPPGVPPSLAKILNRALAATVERRYPTATALADDLSQALYPGLQRDPKVQLRALVQRFMGVRAGPSASARAQLMDVAMLLGDAQSPLPRFATAVAQRTPEEPSEGSLTPIIDDEPQPVQESRESLVGTVLRGYRLTGLLGSGALAHVYRAEHTVLARTAAVKILYGRAAANDRAQRRLEREAVTLSKLRHPNIVEVIDFGFTDDGRPFLMMELLDGRTISQAVKQDGPFSKERAAAVARGVAQALEHAHGLQVIHRDLKPGNVMLVPQADGREQIKVLDFGIARLSDEDSTRLTNVESLLGTPRYMAPEQLSNAHEVGPAADLYALGTMIYAMLSGRPPFVGRTLDVVQKQLYEMPDPLQSQTGLEELAFALMAKQPADRPASARRVLEILEGLDFADPGPTVAVPVSPTLIRAEALPLVMPVPSVLLTQARRPPLAAAAVGALGILAATSLLTYAWIKGRPPEPNAAEARTVLRPKAQVTPNAQATPSAQLTPVAVTAVPTPELGEPVEPPRPSPPPPPASPRSNRSASTKKDLEELTAEARRRLNARGLSSEDLASLPLLAEAKAQLEAKAKQRDESGARAAQALLLERLDRFEPDPELIEAKLRRIGSKLKQAEARVDRAAFDALENRFLDAQAAANGPRARHQLKPLYDLERAVEKAGSE